MKEVEDEPSRWARLKKRLRWENGERERRSFRFIVVCAIVLLVVQQIQMIRVNDQLDDVEETTTDVQDFVKELRHEREQDDPLDEQLTGVFKAVFDTLGLLCLEFPDNAVCAQG